jgi:uncharacterized protein (DUF1330 family)
VSAIRPNRDQLQQFLAAPDDGPVVMLNLLKFARAAGDGSGGGEQAYREYGDAVVTMIEERGGKVLWLGRADQVLIGATDQWDSVVLVQYPSRKAFIEMTSTPEYERAHEHRAAGLEATVVIACTPRLDRLEG